MKRKIFVTAVILTASSLWLSAQDIIVTKDSRKIRAVVTEVNVNDVKYRLFSNQDGPTYMLLKSEIASILYENGDEETFSRAISPSRASSQYPQHFTPEYTQWHVGLSAGVTIQGCESIPNAFGLHGAYFFNRTCGAGLVLRKTNVYSVDDYLFCGPAFFAHMGPNNSKVFVPARIGLGFNKYQYKLKNRSETLFGGYASVGIAIRPIKLVSFGINAEFASAFEDMGDFDFDDVKDNISINMCISFHF